jgi:hypothetical protein
MGLIDYKKECRFGRQKGYKLLESEYTLRIDYNIYLRAFRSRSCLDVVDTLVS